MRSRLFSAISGWMWAASAAMGARASWVFGKHRLGGDQDQHLVIWPQTIWCGSRPGGRTDCAAQHLLDGAFLALALVPLPCQRTRSPTTAWLLPRGWQMRCWPSPVSPRSGGRGWRPPGLLVVRCAWPWRCGPGQSAAHPRAGRSRCRCRRCRPRRGVEAHHATVVVHGQGRGGWSCVWAMKATAFTKAMVSW